MKKSKLIAGILLMILGIGMSVGSVVFHHYEYGRYGTFFSKHRILNSRGVMPGERAWGFQQRPYNVPQKPFDPQPNPKQRKAPNNSTQPNQNQNQGNNSNGGVNQ